MNVLIIGGTGSLGQALTSELLQRQGVHITCLSRDELKQMQMREKFKSNPRLQFVLGDVRDKDSLSRAMQGKSDVFHVAALKHIDSVEANPEEGVKTNIIGTMNVADAACEAGVARLAFSSTDKAVDPINAYGMCKGISEKILFRRNQTQSGTRFSVFRWGNVVASRGSFVHSLAHSLRSEGVARITHPDMTRFWIRIEEAAHFMIENYATAPISRPLFPSMRAAPVTDLISAVAEVVGVSKFRVETIGIRQGEKLHEFLASQHEPYPISSETAPRITIGELKSIIAPILMGAA